MSTDKRPFGDVESDKDSGSLSPTRRKKIEDLGSFQRLQPRLYITNTLAEVSVIWSEKEFGTDAFMQPVYQNIEESSDWLGEAVWFVHGHPEAQGQS